MRLYNDLIHLGKMGQNGLGEQTLNSASVQDMNAFNGFSVDENNTNLKPSADIKRLKHSFQSSFTQAAKDKQGFYAMLDQAFGTNYDRDAAENIRQAAIKEDFSWLPETTVLDSEEFSPAHLNGGNTEGDVFLGAFDKNENSILINNSVLSNEGLANSVYAEEAGHALDNILNRGTDAKGDEGAIFSKLLSGETLSSNQLTSLQNENDHGVVGGREVEFAGLRDQAIDAVYYEVRKHIFAVAYFDVVTGKDDIGIEDPNLNNAAYRQQLLIKTAKEYADDHTNPEKRQAFEFIATLIADQHGANQDRFRVYLDGKSGAVFDPDRGIDVSVDSMLEIRRDYDQHVAEEETKGNFLLGSDGFAFFKELPTGKDGAAGASGMWVDLGTSLRRSNLDQYRNGNNIALAFAHNDVVNGVDGAVEREKALKAYIDRDANFTGKKISSLEFMDQYMESSLDPREAEQILYQYKLHKWVTNNIFELLSYDTNVNNDTVAKNLKNRLSYAFNNQDNDPEAYETVLNEATRRYEGLSLEEINLRVSKGLGFEDKVQELAENSPEALKVFLQFYYEKVNEELAQRGLPAIELKADFVDKLITKLTSNDATIKGEGQSTVSEIFTYVEQLDIGIQKEAYTVYQSFQANVKNFGGLLKGLGDEALENYINTFIRVMGEQYPDIDVDYGDDPLGSIIKILNSETSKSIRELEGIYTFISQQLSGNEVIRTELSQVIDKQVVSNQIIQMAKHSDRAFYDYAKILLGTDEGADFNPEQRSIIDTLLIDIKSGDSATYKESLNGAYGLVKSLDPDVRTALVDRYDLFLSDIENNKNLVSSLTVIATEDSEAFHAFAKKLQGDSYNFDVIENIRKRVANGEADILSDIYEMIVPQTEEVRDELTDILKAASEKRDFRQKYFSMASNKDVFHKASKLFLDDSRSSGVYDEATVENYRLGIIAAIESGDTVFQNQLMKVYEQFGIRNISITTPLANLGVQFQQIYNEFAIENASNEADKINKENYELQVASIADSKPDFHEYVKILLGDDYSDDMKSTIEEWRITIRDKKEGYKDLLTTAYDYQVKPENTNTTQLDYLLDKSELEGMLVDMSKNEALFTQYVERYLQAAYPDGNYPNDVQSTSKELLEKIKTDGRQALAGVFDQQILLDQETKQDLFGIISLSNAETNFKTKFTALAKTPDKFNALIEQTFGTAYNKGSAEELRVKASKGDFSWMPTIQIAGADILAQASLSDDKSSSVSFLGAYDGNTIILNEGIQFDNETLERVLTSELGHALDREVNDGKDAKGDEGEIFQRLLFGEEITESQLNALRAKQDHGVLAGVDVEFDTGIIIMTPDELPAEEEPDPIRPTRIIPGRPEFVEPPSIIRDLSPVPTPAAPSPGKLDIDIPPLDLGNITVNTGSGNSTGSGNNTGGYGRHPGPNGGRGENNGTHSFDRFLPSDYNDNSRLNSTSGSRNGSTLPNPINDYESSYSSPSNNVSSLPNSGVVITNPDLLGSSTSNKANTSTNPAFSFNPDQAANPIPKPESELPHTDAFLNPQGGITMHVLPGDTSLQKIADRYNISVADIKAVNPGLTNYSEDKLRVGDSLVLPFSIVTGPEKNSSVTPSTQLLAYGDDTDLNTLFKTGGRLGLNGRGQADFIGKNAAIFAEAFFEKLGEDPGTLRMFLDEYVPGEHTTRGRQYEAIKKMTEEFSNYSTSNGEPDSKVLQDAIVTNGGLENLDLKVDEGTRIFLPLSVYKDVPIDSPFYKQILNDYSVAGLVGPLDGVLTNDISNKLDISTTDLVDELKPGQSSEMVFRLHHDGSKGPISAINNNALSIKVARDESKGSYTVTVTSSTKLGLKIGLEAPEAFSSKSLLLKASASGAIPESSIYVYEVATAEDAKIIAQLAEQQANSSMLAFNDPVDGWTNISEANRKFLNDHSVQNAFSTGFEEKGQFDFGAVLGSKGYVAKTNVVTRLERDTPTSGQTVHEVSLDKGTTVATKQVVGGISGETKLHDINTNLTVFHNGKKWNDYNTDTKQVSLSFKNINQAGATDADETITPRYNIDPNKLDLSSDSFKNWYFGDGQNRNQNGHQSSFLSYLDSNGVSRDFDESNPPSEVKTLLAAYVLEALPIQPHNPDLMSEIVTKPNTTTPDVQSFSASHQYFSNIFGENHLDGISIDFERTGGEQNRRFLKIDSLIKSPAFGLGASVSHVLTNATSGDSLGRWELSD